MSRLAARAHGVFYVIALGFLAVLAVGSHLVLDRGLRETAGLGQIINESGRQRMRSQRITALALQLREGDEQARDQLRRTIADFERSHGLLVGLAAQEQDQTQAEGRLQMLYFGRGQVNADARRFIAAADRVAAAPRSAASGPAVASDIAVLKTLSRGPLLDGLEQVVIAHQQKSDAGIEQLRNVLWMALMLLLATLLVEAFFIFRPMIARLNKQIVQLNDLAENDFLTGIPNRRTFTNRADAEIERSRRHGRKLSLLVVDVDHFKQINDEHGHPIGDAVLVSLAATLETMARREDVVARFGGEEFVVLLPETSLATAGVVGNRIREAIARTPFEAEGCRIDMTVSIGCAAVSLDGEMPLERALRTADNMLYCAKRAGRNCVWPELALAGGGGAEDGGGEPRDVVPEFAQATTARLAGGRS